MRIELQGYVLPHDLLKEFLFVFLLCVCVLCANTSLFGEVCPHAQDKAEAVTVKQAPPTPLPVVTFSGTLVNFTEVNPGSGPHPNQWGVTSQIELGADIELERALRWKGASIELRESIFEPKYNAVLHIGSNAPSATEGHYWDQDVGSTLVSTTFQDFAPTSYLSELVVRQKLGGRVDLRIGRFSPTLEFDQAVNCETLLSCLNPITIYDNKTLPPAIATWGTFATFKASDKDVVKVGVSQSDFLQLNTSGWNWSLRSGTGAFFAAEYTHGVKPSDKASGTFLTAGFWHDASQFSDPFTSALQRGSSAAYGRFEKPIWPNLRDRISKPRLYLTAFSTGSYSFSSAQPYHVFVNSGVNLHGVQSRRPSDHYGLNISYLRVRTNELQAEQALRLKLSGISFRSANDQVRVEANAHLSLRASMSIEPSLAYIVNPNVQFATPTARYGPPQDGFVLGLVTFIDLRAFLHPGGKRPQ